MVALALALFITGLLAWPRTAGKRQKRGNVSTICRSTAARWILFNPGRFGCRSRGERRVLAVLAGGWAVGLGVGCSPLLKPCNIFSSGHWLRFVLLLVFLRY